MKIRPVDRLFRTGGSTGGQTDGLKEDNSRFSQFCERSLTTSFGCSQNSLPSKNQWLITANPVHAAICNALTSVVIRTY